MVSGGGALLLGMCNWLCLPRQYISTCFFRPAWSSWTLARHMIASAAHGSSSACPAWALARMLASGSASCCKTLQPRQHSMVGSQPAFQNAQVFSKAAHCRRFSMCWGLSLLLATSGDRLGLALSGQSACQMVSLHLSATSMQMTPACMCCNHQMLKWPLTAA